MKLKRKDYIDFLQTEYDTQMREFGRLISTKALVLKERGEVFVGKYVGIKDDFAIFKVRVSDNMPRKNSFWTASCLIGEMASFKNWGNISWAGLREQYQSEYSDAYCAWISKSDDSEFCLIGVKNITLEFAELLKTEKPIIAFGPKDPPLQYLLNLMEVVKDTTSLKIHNVLEEIDDCGNSWNPQNVSAIEDLNAQIFEKFETNNVVAIQGPPGTGKTFRMAKLVAKILKDGKSVLVTSLTNEALKAIAGKDSLNHALSDGKITKTSLTLDEHHELPNLIANEGNVCNPIAGNLSLATFYVASGWAKNLNTEPPFDYVIVDEASQALLPMLACSMKLGRKVVWIGDQMQLAPIVITNEDILKSRGWNPIVDGFSTACNNINMPGFLLNDTFRLPPRGAEFTGLFYNGKLNSVAKFEELTIDIPEINDNGGPSLLPLSLKIGDKKPVNAMTVIFDLTERILMKDSKATIAILSKFKETVKELQKIFVTRYKEKEVPDNIKIETVDRIQGLTVDYTIFLIPNASIRYSLENEFFNVATSRALKSTVIVADQLLLKNFMSKEVRQFLLKLDRGKVAEFETSATQTVAVGDIKVTVLGKIDLPEKRFKEIQPDKENIFIIDTNVFVRCPTIISKIGKYKIVIPTTVLEELDSLKLKPSIDKNAINDAVRNINKSFMNNFSKMEEGDSSLLPEGFNGKKADCLILSVALKYISEDRNPILLTSDNLLQSKALGLGITTISLRDFLSERK